LSPVTCRFVASEIKVNSQVPASDANGIRALRDSLELKGALVRGVVLHPGQARPLKEGILALPWGWLAPKTAQQPHMELIHGFHLQSQKLLAREMI
jgi:hypothetical protein